MSTTVPLSQVQRIVVRRIGLQFVRHYLLRVAKPKQACAFLQTLAPRIPSAASDRPEASAAAIALTYPGLQALQLRDEYLAVFRKLAPAFVSGAAARAAAHLGDTGANESPGWEAPFRSTDTHVLLTLFGSSEAQLDQDVAQLQSSGANETGLKGWNSFMSGRHSGPGEIHLEPFGFRDGISQPTIKGVHLDWAQRNPRSMHGEVGEFLLGHANEDGANRWGAPDLPLEVREFVGNGSFGALRKMRQHVEEFKRLSPLVRAKMCGRWPNGAPVQQGQTSEPAAPPADRLNQFDFTHDSQGLGCPFASHIRRLNPRGDRAIPPRKRLLMRRGVPYRTDAEEGLLGLFLCADLEGQFEFLLGDWMRDAPLLPPGSRAPDPLFGGRGDIAATFPMPVPGPTPGSAMVEQIAMKDYVTTRGTLYGFYPSLKALGMIEDLRSDSG